MSIVIMLNCYAAIINTIPLTILKLSGFKLIKSMDSAQDNHWERGEGRLVSLDFFRGFTMLLLVNGGVLHYFARPQFEGTLAHAV